MSLLCFNSSARHLLWEPAWFLGLVRYFNISQRKSVYINRRQNIYMKARKDFSAIKLKAEMFPLHCNKAGVFFPSVCICVKKSWRTCRPQGEYRRVCIIEFEG